MWEDLYTSLVLPSTPTLMAFECQSSNESKATNFSSINLEAYSEEDEGATIFSNFSMQFARNSNNARVKWGIIKQTQYIIKYKLTHNCQADNIEGHPPIFLVWCVLSGTQRNSEVYVLVAKLLWKYSNFLLWKCYYLCANWVIENILRRLTHNYFIKMGESIGWKHFIFSSYIFILWPS